VATRQIEILFPSSIMGLFVSCRPSNISRLIVAVIVRKAIKGMLRCWPFSHICEKVFKVIFFPACANLNSSPAVIFPILRVRVVATGQHRLPVAVFGSFRKSVRQISVSDFVSAETTTANRYPLAHRFSFNDFFITAVATTEPKCATFATLAKFYYVKATKCLTTNINALLRGLFTTPTTATFLLSLKKNAATNGNGITAVTKAEPLRSRRVFHEFNYSQAIKFLTDHINWHDAVSIA